jgi:hypothetical protein
MENVFCSLNGLKAWKEPKKKFRTDNQSVIDFAVSLREEAFERVSETSSLSTSDCSVFP